MNPNSCVKQLFLSSFSIRVHLFFISCIGGSNGGMLVGNMYVQRPDLFGAVRSHQLLSSNTQTIQKCQHILSLLLSETVHVIIITIIVVFIFIFNIESTLLLIAFFFFHRILPNFLPPFYHLSHTLILCSLILFF